MFMYSAVLDSVYLISLIDYRRVKLTWLAFVHWYVSHKDGETKFLGKHTTGFTVISARPESIGYAYPTSDNDRKTDRVLPGEFGSSIHIRNMLLKKQYFLTLCPLPEGQPCLSDENFSTNHHEIVEWTYRPLRVLTIQMRF